MEEENGWVLKSSIDVTYFKLDCQSNLYPGELCPVNWGLTLWKVLIVSFRSWRKQRWVLPDFVI